MNLDDYGLNLYAIENNFSGNSFKVRKRKFLIPGDLNNIIKKKSLMRIGIDWRGRTLACIYYRTYEDQPTVTTIVNLPTKKSTSQRHYTAWIDLPDFEGKDKTELTPKEILEEFLNTIKSYTGTNSTRVAALHKALSIEIEKLTQS